MHPISTVISNIASNLESLRDFIDTLDTYLQQKVDESVATHLPVLEIISLIVSKGISDKDISDNFPESTQEYLSNLGKKYHNILSVEVSEDNQKFQFNATMSEGTTLSDYLKDNSNTIDFSHLISEIQKAKERPKMLYSSSLMTLASSVELFFYELFHQYFILYPEAISNKDKVFSFDDLEKFDTLRDARTHYISSKIEDILRGSVSDWIVFARNTLKVSMGYIKEEQELLEETFQRRNVVVHNGGIANSIYIAKTSKKLSTGIKIGDDIKPNREYLSESIDLWEKNCILIAAELWKNIAREDIERGQVLLAISYKHLLAGRWVIASSISVFLMHDKQMSENILLSAQLNYWQCQKRLNKWNNICLDVAKADYSAKGIRYQLGRLALLDQADQFYSLLPRAISTGDITENDLQEYPIFTSMRDDPRYEIYKPKGHVRKLKRRKKRSSN